MSRQDGRGTARLRDCGAGGQRLRALEPWEQVCGTFVGVSRSGHKLRLTFAFRRTITVEHSPELLRRLARLKGRQVGLLCVGDGQYRIKSAGRLEENG